MADDEKLKRLGGGRWESKDGRFSIEPQSGTWVVVDLFDAADLDVAMAANRPQVVIHQVTNLALKPGEELSDEQLARNAEVREVGTSNLIEAAVAAGAQRVIAQSIAWLYLPGSEPHTETESIVPADPRAVDRTRRGVIELERLVTSDPRLAGIVLRYGRLYGPRTWAAMPPEPPTVHVNAAARAAALAVNHGEPGIYNIVDDDGPISNAKARRLLGWQPG